MADDTALVAGVADRCDAAGGAERFPGAWSRTVASSRGVIRAGSGRTWRGLARRHPTWSELPVMWRRPADLSGQQAVEEVEGLAARHAVEAGGDGAPGTEPVEPRDPGDGRADGGGARATESCRRPAVPSRRLPARNGGRPPGCRGTSRRTCPPKAPDRPGVVNGTAERPRPRPRSRGRPAAAAPCARRSTARCGTPRRSEDRPRNGW